MIAASVKVRVSSRKCAESLVRAVGPDNHDMNGLVVRSRVTASAAIFNIKYDGKIETFISTLDDLVRCLQAAKDTIDRISRE